MKRGILDSIPMLLVAVLCGQLANAQDIGFGTTMVRLDEFATGFAIEDPPTDMVPLLDGSGRFVVSTFTGSVRLIDADGNFLDTDINRYIDERSTSQVTFEYGATSVAVHPNFATNGKIYGIVTEANSATPVDFGSVNSDHDDVLVEWTIQDSGLPGLADDIASNNPTFIRRDILRAGQPVNFHNMVDLAFDGNGLLYVSSGDGGSSPGTSQDTTTLFGNILRIDPMGNNSANGQYGIPIDNPFVGDGGGVAEEIYAYGFRSPFRINFDADGNLYVGDVGASHEELNVIDPDDTSDPNYGWSLTNGTNTSDSLRDPVFDYRTRVDGESIIAGFVYEGSAIPELIGKYIFADFGRQVTAGQEPTPSRLFYGDLDTGDVFELLIDPTGQLIADNGDTVANIFSIAEGPDGELYLLVGDDPFPSGPAAGIPQGRILKIVPEPASLLLAVGFGGALLMRRRR